MIRATHLILGMYGFWLPNDERGSWSDFIGSWELLRFGSATTIHTRHSRAHQPFDPAQRAAAKARLKHPSVILTGAQALAIGRGFAHYAKRANVVIYACAILPEHIHLVIARHRHQVETIAQQLKSAATRRLIAEDLHPQAAHQGGKRRPPKAFARGQWKVYLNSDAAIARAINYVEQNPVREHLPRQRWHFVTPPHP